MQIAKIMKIKQISTKFDAYFHHVAICLIPTNDANVLHEADCMCYALRGWVNIDNPIL